MSPNTVKINHGEHVSKFRLSDAADPRDGVRLIKAFLDIKESALREKLIRLAEDFAKASSGHLGTAKFEENQKHAFRKSLPMISARIIGRPRSRAADK